MFDSEETSVQKIFEEIYNSDYADLCVFARRFVNKEDAEEIVQSSIVNLWNQRDRLGEIDSVKAYLFRCVRNLCINQIKHQKYISDYQDKAFLDLKEIETLHYEENYSFDMRDKIEDAIQSLPIRCREVFEMSRFDGLKYKEIADNLGISVKAVEANISRALTCLRDSLEKYADVNILLIIISTFYVGIFLQQLSSFM